MNKLIATLGLVFCLCLISGCISVAEGDEPANSVPLMQPSASSWIHRDFSPEAVVDGKKGTVWRAKANESQWLLMDLGADYFLDAYHLDQETGSAEEGASVIKDYVLQASSDGLVFYDLDTVFGNEEMQKDKELKGQRARYIRLYAYPASDNDEDFIQVSDLKVYGQPAYAEIQFDACDDITEWISDNEIRMEKEINLEGFSSLASSGKGPVQFKKLLPTPFNTGVQEGNGLLTFWYYISDLSSLATNGWIEISSSHEERIDAYSWKFSSLPSELKDGWNYVQLDLRRADRYGFPDLTAINYICIQTDANDPLRTMIDDIRFAQREFSANPSGLGLVYEVTGENDGPAVEDQFADADYSFRLGDYLEYDVYLKDYAIGIGAIDIRTGDGATLMGRAGWNDSNLAPVEAAVDLTRQAYNRWHHRKIRIPESLVGQTAESWLLVADLEEGQSGAVAVFDNIAITDNQGRVQLDLFSSPDEEMIKVLEDEPVMTLEVVGNDVSKAPEPKVIETRFPTEDIVIADYIVTDDHYGAVGDGVADDTHAIQKALDDCYKAGGGTVWLPEGKYRVTSPIHIGAFVTLRGDWNDPDVRAASESYGTVIIADVESSKNPRLSLFRIGGSAGAMGLTVYYPDQNIENPVPYPYTFTVPGNAWGAGSENYMSSSVLNCTLLNSYKGIGVSTLPNEAGFSAMRGQVHEMENIENIKGSPLYVGAEAYNSADVGTWSNINFKGSYWADAGVDHTGYDFNPEGYTREDISGWTRENGIGLKLGDLEWVQFYNVNIEDYEIGVKIVRGYRIAFAGIFSQLTVKNSDVAFSVNSLDLRWGLGILRSNLEGTTASIHNRTAGYVKVADTLLNGDIVGDRIEITDSFTSPESHKAIDRIPGPGVRDLLVVHPEMSGDDSQRIQEALDRAGGNGGGTVYLQAGIYKIGTPLDVPANVELRGVAATPARDQLHWTKGTVLFAYYGKGNDDDRAKAMINLEENSGIRGIRIFYPENNPKKGIEPYPYTIRSHGDGIYIINTAISNGYKLIDFKTNESSGYYIKKLIGCAYDTGIYAGGDEGWIEGTLQNATNAVRNGYGIPGWFTEAELFAELIIPITTQKTTWIKLDGAKNVHMLNNFTYGARNILTAENGSEATIINIGADGEGRGISIDDSSSIVVGNFMKLYENVTDFIFEIYNYLKLL